MIISSSYMWCYEGHWYFPHLNDNTSSHVSVPPCETTLVLVSIRSSTASVSFGVNQHPAFYVHAVNMGLNRRCFLGIFVTRINSASVSGRLLGSGCSLGLFVPSCGCLDNCTHIWGWKKQSFHWFSANSYTINIYIKIYPNVRIDILWHVLSHKCVIKSIRLIMSSTDLTRGYNMNHCRVYLHSVPWWLAVTHTGSICVITSLCAPLSGWGNRGTACRRQEGGDQVGGGQSETPKGSERGLWG